MAPRQGGSHSSLRRAGGVGRVLQAKRVGASKGKAWRCFDHCCKAALFFPMVMEAYGGMKTCQKATVACWLNAHHWSRVFCGLNVATCALLASQLPDGVLLGPLGSSCCRPSGASCFLWCPALSEPRTDEQSTDPSPQTGNKAVASSTTCRVLPEPRDLGSSRHTATSLKTAVSIPLSTQ